MSSFAGSITALFVAGMVGGYAGLCMLGPSDERQQTAALAAARIPDPPALPCSMQAWPNADRKCLDWTAPRAGVAEAKTDGAQKISANVPPPDKRPATVGQPSRRAAGPGSCVMRQLRRARLRTRQGGQVAHGCPCQEQGIGRDARLR
jgi:hypothetical protein